VARELKGLVRCCKDVLGTSKNGLLGSLVDVVALLAMQLRQKSGADSDGDGPRQQAKEALALLEDGEAALVLCQFVSERPQLADGLIRFMVPELTLAPTKALERRFVGTIQLFDDDEGLGIIECHELGESLGCPDVALTRSQLGTFRVGDSVSFAALLDEECRPQAFDLLGHSPEVPVAEAAPPRQMTKTVEAPKTVPPRSAPRVVPKLIKTEARAVVAPVPAAVVKIPPVPPPAVAVAAGAAAPASAAEVPGVTDQRFIGTVVSFNQGANFGFIHCPDLRDLYQKDVWVHREQLGQFSVGDEVSFGVLINKDGFPQAKEVFSAIADNLADAHQFLAEVPGVTDRRFVGTILSFFEQQNFGFIQCTELRDLYQKDVWVHRDQLGPFAPGHLVSFSVLINKNGYPQATDLENAARAETSPAQSAAPAPPSAADVPGVTDRRFSGTVVSYNPVNNFGFIQCQDLRELYQKDVWVHRDQLGGFSVGDSVTFSVLINKNGYPQAKDLLPPRPEPSRPAPASALDVPGITDQRFNGTIVHFSPAQNFGFISCAELRTVYQKDVWVHGEQIGHFKVGDPVLFSVLLNKDGHPQAKDLSPPDEVPRNRRRLPLVSNPSAKRAREA